MSSKTKYNSLARALPAMLLLLSGTMLAGCKIRDAALDDKYYPTYDERYAIKVEKHPANLGIRAHQGNLSPEQINAITAFANQAKSNSQSAITIKYPSGVAGSREAANQVAQVMVQGGVMPASIHAASYSGGRGSPVQITYLKMVAVTKPCGNWNSNLAIEAQNDSYDNFGCAIRNNMAAMVANAEDFDHPRTMDPILAANRMKALQIYIDNPQAGAVSSTQLGQASSGGGSGGGGSGG